MSRLIGRKMRGKCAIPRAENEKSWQTETLSDVPDGTLALQQRYKITIQTCLASIPDMS